MSQISACLKARFNNALQNSTAILSRHPHLTMADELDSVIKAINECDVRDMYGSGGLVAEFEVELSELFEKSNCVFLPTGVLAQCAAMKCYSEDSGKSGIGLHPSSHLLLHEYMAIEALWGLTTVPTGEYNKVLSVDELTSLDPSSTCAIIIELPMREIGGVLPNWAQLLEMRRWCDKNDVKMHMDGARVWQITDHFDRSLAEIAALFDSVYVSFYKDLGAISGAALLGDNGFVKAARVWARRAGGNPITLYPEVISARKGLQNFLPKMSDYAKFSRSLAKQLSSAFITVIPEQPETSMFHLQMNMSPDKLAEKIVIYAERTGVMVLPLPRSGNKQESICEITIGDNALAHSTAYWTEHIANMLS
jgi:threonine aldolase